MDFRDLRYFRAIAEQCSFSPAADVLQISQHALSRAVQQLEIDLDAALFERHEHGARLTKTERVLAKRTNTLLRQIEQTWAKIQGGIETPSGVLDFAIPHGAATYLVPPIISALRAEFPNVFLGVYKGFSGQLSDWMLRGQVDLACITTRRRCAASPQLRSSTRKCSSSGATYRSKRASPACRTYLTRHLFIQAAPIVYAGSSTVLLRKAAPRSIRSPKSTVSQLLNFSFGKALALHFLTWGAISEEVERFELNALKFRSVFFALAADTIGTKRRGTFRTSYIPDLNSLASRTCIDRCRDLGRSIARPAGLTKWIKRT